MSISQFYKSYQKEDILKGELQFIAARLYYSVEKQFKRKNDKLI